MLLPSWVLPRVARPTWVTFNSSIQKRKGRIFLLTWSGNRFVSLWRWASIASSSWNFVGSNIFPPDPENIRQTRTANIAETKFLMAPGEYSRKCNFVSRWRER